MTRELHVGQSARAVEQQTARATSRRMISVAGVLLLLSLALFLCQIVNFRTFRAEAKGAESLPVSIRAESQADYSGEAHPSAIPPIDETILMQIIWDIQATGAPQDRMATLQVALLSPVPTMTTDPRFPATATLAWTATSIRPTRALPTVRTTFVVPTLSIAPTATAVYSYPTYQPPAPTSTKHLKQPTKTATASPTVTQTSSAVPTNTPTSTPSPTTWATSSPTLTPTVTATWTASLTNTLTATLTATHTSIPSFTHTATHTSTLTATPTGTSTSTVTFTATPTASATSSPTQTPSATATPTNTPTATATPSETPTVTPSQTPTYTATPTATQTDTPVATHTATETATAISTSPPSSTPSPIATATSSETPTSTPTWTATQSATPTFTPTYTNTPTLIPTSTATETPTSTATPTFTPSPIAAPTDTPSPTQTESPTPTASATPSQTATATQTLTSTPTPTSSSTSTPTLTPTHTPTLSFTSSPTLVPGLPACYSGTPGGLLPSDDTYIDGGSPTRINGADNKFEVRPDNGADRRGLLQFDLSSIPSNATVTSATLYLYEGSNKTGQTTYIYRVTSSWNETTANWNTWSTPGGDFDSSTSYFAYLPEQSNCLLTMDITNLAQAWVNGTYNNYGLLLYSTGPNHIISYTSKEDTNAVEWPRLNVVYTLPGATPTP